MPRLLIVGASDAGISAALRARELAPGWEVTIAASDRFPNFSICGIPYFLSGEVPAVSDLAHRKAADIEALGIELLLESPVEAIDPSSRTVRVRGFSERRYDALVLGTGATSIRPPIAGLDLPGVFLLRWMSDTFAFDAFLSSRAPRRIVIVGGGYIGLEMAEAMTHRGIAVTVVEMAPNVMTTIDPDLGELVARELKAHGVDVVTRQPVSSISNMADELVLEGPGGFRRTADMVLVAAGARPETALAQSIGARPGFRGALQVDRSMRTGVPHVYAAGDCAETYHRITRANTYLPLGTTAHKQGRVAGENAVGGDRQFQGSLGTQSVRIFGLVVARTGFHDRDATAAGFAPLSVDTVSWDHKVYYPGAKEMTIRVTADRTSSRLLGAQIVGAYGTEVSKRIDIFAAAIHHGMTVEEVSDLDLSYTPPLSSPWDPVQMAAQAWSRRARNHDLMSTSANDVVEVRA
ncbi:MULTISPECIES: FAD-dependent oxidoreductase [Xanthobacter]|uniref:FAD-dependent oxidoreductase n=1 Tax=Xanthobacter TaxID=279 RepID=UPI00372B40D3